MLNLPLCYYYYYYYCDSSSSTLRQIIVPFARSLRIRKNSLMFLPSVRPFVHLCVSDLV
jgi:hypothetical protein